jgi:predicted GIY-YIG superfamily endonuclease
MHYVYRIQSVRYPDREYTGFTADLKKRLSHHNDGCCDSTRPFMPWKVIGYTAFENEAKARAFERYLKTGSGSAFAKKRLW